MGQMDIFRRVFWSIALIRVSAATEPTDFDRKVRTPGAAFLRATPNPTNQQWRGYDYWRRALGDLYNAYGGMCAYCASWTYRPQQTTRPQDGTVDHFIPKSAMPAEAYEWRNYRLSRSRLNMHKGDHQDVLDPFTVVQGWFKLDFRTFLLAPNQALSPEDRARVIATIERLQLNTDNDYVNERVGAIREYSLGKVTLEQLAKSYPFFAAEIQEQDFDTKYLPRMREFFRQNSRAD